MGIDFSKFLHCSFFQKIFFVRFIQISSFLVITVSGLWILFFEQSETKDAHNLSIKCFLHSLKIPHASQQNIRIQQKVLLSLKARHFYGKCSPERANALRLRKQFTNRLFCHISWSQGLLLFLLTTTCTFTSFECS